MDLWLTAGLKSILDIQTNKTSVQVLEKYSEAAQSAKVQLNRYNPEPKPADLRDQEIKRLEDTDTSMVPWACSSISKNDF